MRRLFILALVLNCFAWLAAQSITPTMHTVQAGETMYGISRTYNVTVDDLMKANSLTETSTLSIGQKLLIPVQPKVQQASNTTHIVEAGETYYSISRAYGIKVPDLLQANGLDESAILSIGQQLVIPNAKEAKATKESKPKNKRSKNAEPEEVVEEIIYEAPVVEPVVVKNDVPVRVAFLLPLELDLTIKDSAVAISHVKRQDGSVLNQTTLGHLKLERFVEYYQGALLAINELARKGVHVEVQTYDIGRSEAAIQKVLDSVPALKTADLLFALTYKEQLKAVSEYSFHNKKYCVLPVSPEVPDLRVNPYLIQFNVQDSIQQFAKVNFLKNQAKSGANIVLVHAKGESMSDITAIKTALRTAEIPFAEQDPMEEPTADALRLKMDSTRRNLLVFAVSKTASTTPWMKVLAELPNFQVACMGDYQWLNHKADIKTPFYYVSLFASANDNMESYKQNYAAYFNEKMLSSTTPRYDAMAYDLTNYFIELMHKYGIHFADYMAAEGYNGVYITPHFYRTTSTGGYQNRGVKIYKTNSGVR